MPRFRANLYLPPFPARTFHAQLPLCPNMESPSSTPPPPENYIIGQHATGSHCPAIFRCRGGGTGPFHTRSKRPAARKWVMNRLSQRESLQIALHLWTKLYRSCWQPFWAQGTPRVSTTEPWPKFRICGVGGGHFLREFKDEYRGIEGYICEVPTWNGRIYWNFKP